MTEWHFWHIRSVREFWPSFIKKRIRAVLGCPNFVFYGVSDGTWTHDNQGHNLGLYQLSYTHHIDFGFGIADLWNTAYPNQTTYSVKDLLNIKPRGIFQEETWCWRLLLSNIMTILNITNRKGNHLNQFQIFFIRAIIGAFFAVVITRMFYGSVPLAYVAGLAIILVGLAYFAEFLRKRKSR